MCFLEYITTMSFSADDRLYVAVIIKNKVKKYYGQHTYSSYKSNKEEKEYVAGSEDDPETHMDEQGRAILQ